MGLSIFEITMIIQALLWIFKFKVMTRS